MTEEPTPEQIEREFTMWRNSEVDRTGTLPTGYEMFRAAYELAASAVDGRHDHIEDGSSYLDCIACVAATSRSRPTRMADAVIVDMLTAFYGAERDGWSTKKVARMRAALVAAAGAAPRGDDLVERVADALAYYQCRETNPKADHPRMGYYAFSEDQRAHLRERKAEAAAEIARMMTAAGVTAHEPTLCAECNETEVLGSPAQQVLCMDCAYEHGRAGAAPQELSGNQAELIAEARSRAEHPGTGSNTAQCLRECADALEAAGNAPGQADEAKLGDLIAATIREVDGDHTMGAGALGEVIAGAVSERLRGGGR